MSLILRKYEHRDRVSFWYEREIEGLYRCSLVNKVSQWTLRGFGFNPYIPHEASSKLRGYEWSSREVRNLGFEPNM